MITHRTYWGAGRRGSQAHVEGLIAGKAVVLYLRSFADGEQIRALGIPGLSNEEEDLAAAVGMIGPLRTASDNNRWKDDVSGLMEHAALVVIRLNTGKDLWWEIGEVFRRVSPERIVILMPWSDEVYQHFRQRLPEVASLPVVPVIPDDIAGVSPLTCSVRGLFYFGRDLTAHFVPMRDAGYRRSARYPFRPMMHIALKPVCEQLGIAWTPPPIGFIYFWRVCYFSVIVGGVLYALWRLLSNDGFRFRNEAGNMLSIMLFVLLVWFSICLLSSLGYMRAARGQFRRDEASGRWIECY